jgi:hypothetical protein
MSPEMNRRGFLSGAAAAAAAVTIMPRRVCVWASAGGSGPPGRVAQGTFR